MFRWFKRRQSTDSGQDFSASIDALFDEAYCEHEREYERVSDYTSKRLDTLRVDVSARTFTERDGTVVPGITEMVWRIHNAEPSMPVDQIDTAVISWLEQSYCPEQISEEQIEALQLEIDDWVEEHINQQ